MTAGSRGGDGTIGDTLDFEIIQALERQFSGFPVPGKQPFDPSIASPELLRTLGLPPKPDPRAQPLLFHAWNKAFGRPMILEAFDIERIVFDSQYRPLVRAADVVPVSGTRFETSNNWSGAYITANHDRRFLQIWGAWTIPDNLQLPLPALRGPKTRPYICSNWIGLDGQRLYFDSSLPQIGTSSTLEDDGTTTAQAWTQWWARDDPMTGPLPLGLAVSPGDEVLCVLTALTPRNVNFVMVNLNHPLPIGIVVKASPPVPVPGGSPVQPDIAGATAEWIMERPNVEKLPGTPCNFPDYGETEFEFCFAVEGHHVDIASWFTGLVQDLRGTRLLRMFDVLPDPNRTVFISMPEKLDDTSIRVKYGGF